MSIDFDSSSESRSETGVDSGEACSTGAISLEPTYLVTVSNTLDHLQYNSREQYNSRIQLL